MSKIIWECSKEETILIHEIAKRAVKDYARAGVKLDFIDTSMDITACHLNGNPLDLEKLLKADPFNFAHDITGIARHIDRETGQLKDCFLPRCSK